MAIFDKTSCANDRFHGIIREIEISDGFESCGLRPGPTADTWDRFKLWVGNIGANHQSASSLSLESRLAGAAELLQEVMDLLDDLTDALTELHEILIGHQDNRSVLPIRILAGDISEGSKDENDAEMVTAVPDVHSEAQGLLGAINECIRSLFRVSILIARATPRDRFSLAQNSGRNLFPDEFDINYVEERYPKLSGPDSAWLCKRLGRANTRRRQFLRYCRQHRDALAGGSRQNYDAKGLSPLATMDDEKPGVAEEQVSLTAPVVANPIAELLDIVSGTVLTKPSTKASTLNIEMLRENEGTVEDDDTKSYLSAASSADIDAEEYLEVPRLADVNNGNDTFECPFCCIIKRFTREKSWRKHAYDDLRAYVCTVGGPECDNELFGDQKTWFNHESRRHRSQWVCILCQVEHFRTPSRLKDHVVKHHPDLKPEVVESLVSAGQRPLQVIPASDCPFCDKWENTLRFNLEEANIKTSTTTDGMIVVDAKHFRQHVASHLQQLALFSIPRSIKDDALDGCASAAAQQSASSRRHFEGNTPADIVEASWDDPNPPLQQAIARGNLLEMMRLLEDENADPNTIGETWGTALDAALLAPWDKNMLDVAINTLRSKGGVCASELLGENDSIGAARIPLLEETNIEESQMSRNEHLSESPLPPGHSSGLQPNTTKTFDQTGAVALKPQEETSLPKPAVPGSWQPQNDGELRMRRDIHQLQSALTLLGHSYDMLNIVHFRILALFTREHSQATTNFSEVRSRALREIWDDLERWEMLFQYNPGFAASTGSRNQSKGGKSHLSNKNSEESIKSQNDMNIERFREVLAIEFPKLNLPARLVHHLYQPSDDRSPTNDLRGARGFKTEGMGWDDFVYSILLIRVLQTIFQRNTAPTKHGNVSFEQFLVAMSEVTLLQRAINPQSSEMTASMDTDTWHTVPDGRPSLRESLVKTSNDPSAEAVTHVYRPHPAKGRLPPTSRALDQYNRNAAAGNYEHVSGPIP